MHFELTFLGRGRRQHRPSRMETNQSQAWVSRAKIGHSGTEPLSLLALCARCFFLLSSFFLAIQGSVSLLLEPSVPGVEPEDGPVLPFGVGGDAVMLRAGKVAGELKGRERRSPGSLQFERGVRGKRNMAGDRGRSSIRLIGRRFCRRVLCPNFPDSCVFL